MTYSHSDEIWRVACIRAGARRTGGLAAAMLAIALSGGCDIDPAVASSLIDAAAGLINVVLQLGLLHFLV